MYDDYDLDYTFSQDYSLDEDTYYEYYVQLDQLDQLDLEEDYTRDAQDYDALAYRHYAWYNITHVMRYIIHTHPRTPPHVNT